MEENSLKSSFKIENELKNKSIEAFLLAIEIYNKPTIKYRLEGCLYFLCNAWELLLKGKLLKDGKSIYYKKSKQTYSLSTCLEKVLPNAKDAIRINMDVIISLRNISTHLIIPEYQILASGFLTSCAKNYSDKLFDYFGVNINDIIDNDFMTLFICEKPQQIDILNKYGKEIFDKFTEIGNNLNNVLTENGDNSKVAIGVKINLVRVRDRAIADFKYFTTNDENDSHALLIHEYLNPRDKYIYTGNTLIKEVTKQLGKANIILKPVNPKASTTFNNYSFNLYKKIYKIEENSEYSYKIQISTGHTFWFSQSLVTKIVADLTADPELIYELNEKSKKKN